MGKTAAWIGLRVLGALAALGFSGLALAYCPSNGGNTSYEYIDRVAINGDGRASGDDGGYGGYTQIPFEASTRSLSIELTAGYPGGSSYTENWSVWIDLDGNGAFDAAERLFSGSGVGTVSGTIDLPAGAIAGSTGLRISMRWGSAATDPCGTFTYGEVEDYTIVLPEGGGDPVLAELLNCDGDLVEGLADHGEIQVGRSEDLVPLCNGWVLLGDRADNRVKLVDVVNGSVGATYGLSSAPGELALDAIKGVLYAALDGQPAIASIDLDTGTVTEIGIDHPAIDIAVADDGNLLAIVQAGTAWWERPIAIIDPELGQLSLFEPSSQARGAQLLAFDAANGYLFTGDAGSSPSSLTRYLYQGGDLVEDEYLRDAGSNGQDLAVSPDGQHLAFACGGGNGDGYTMFDFPPDEFRALNGEWDTGAYPSSADFDAASSLFAALNYDEMLVFDAGRKVLLHRHKPTLTGCDYSDLEKARFSRGGSILFAFTNCGFDDDSGRLVWTLHGQTPGGTEQAQTPWRDNAADAVVTGIAWNYAMGYHFSPQADGKVTALGGLFEGTKVVRLFDRNSGAQLAETTVTSSNDWAYTGLDQPVPVTAGGQYTVAVYLAGSGGAYQRLTQALPQVYGDIRIEGSTYAYTGSNPNERPAGSVTGIMYGVADIEFVPGSGSAPPVNASCYDDVTDGLASYGEIEIGPSSDMVPLCSGQVLLGDSADNAVKLVDIADGSVRATYQLTSAPGKLSLDAQRGLLYVTLNAKVAIAEIDLSMGTVAEIGIDHPAIDVAVADDGNLLAIVQAGTAWWERPIAIVDPELGQLSLFEPSSQARGAQLLAFDAVNGYLITGDSGSSPSSLTRYLYQGGGLVQSQFLSNAGSNGQDLAVSPDGQHLAFACGGGNGSGYTIFDFSPGNFTVVDGEWNTGAYPGSADFDASSTLLGALNYNEMLVFDVSTKAMLHSYTPALSGCDYSDLKQVRFSRGSAILFGRSNCGYDDDSGRLVWSLHQQ